MFLYVVFFLENVTWKQIVLVSIAIRDQTTCYKNRFFDSYFGLWYPRGITCICYRNFFKLFQIRIEGKFVFLICRMYTFIYYKKSENIYIFHNLGFVTRHIKTNIYYTIFTYNHMFWLTYYKLIHDYPADNTYVNFINLNISFLFISLHLFVDTLFLSKAFLLLVIII